MKILVVGAGALGGFYGGCLARASRDVTFMVRAGRAKQLAHTGLQIVSPNGDFSIEKPVVQIGAVKDNFDLVLLALKSYSLEEAMNDFATAIGPNTLILPVINGIAHLQVLSERFGSEKVLGGMALISATLDAEGRVIHLMPNQELVFGELHGGLSDRTARLTALFEGAVNAKASDAVMLDMWEKWTLLATNAGITGLMRASIGDIIAAPNGADTIMRLFNECSCVADAYGFKPRSQFVEFCMTLLTQVGSPLKASLLRDIERGVKTEGHHVLGELVMKAQDMSVDTPTLNAAWTHVYAYEIGRARSSSSVS